MNTSRVFIIQKRGLLNEDGIFLVLQGRKQFRTNSSVLITPFPSFLSGFDVLGGGQLPDAEASQDTGTTERRIAARAVC